MRINIFAYLHAAVLLREQSSERAALVVRLCVRTIQRPLLAVSCHHSSCHASAVIPSVGQIACYNVPFLLLRLHIVAVAAHTLTCHLDRCPNSSILKIFTAD